MKLDAWKYWKEKALNVNYHNTTEVAYCVPYLHNMLQIS